MVVYFTIEIRIFRTTPFFLYTLYSYKLLYATNVSASFFREFILRDEFSIYRAQIASNNTKHLRFIVYKNAH